MIDIKQIQYFVACARTGSFSQAAQNLFTTQPSVSRVIKAMEEELGFALFERHAKGISLTSEGAYIFEYAESILENLQKLELPIPEKTVTTLRVAANPSSWFADMFLEFYQTHQEEKLHYQIHSVGTLEIVQRVQARLDDIGFVYVIRDQLPAFEFFLEGNYLAFEEMSSTDIRLHPGMNHPYWTQPDQFMDLAKLRLVQRFQDEFSPCNYWNLQDERGHLAADSETVVVTNSDYIMERLLKESDLVHISGGYLTAGNSEKQEGIPVAAEPDEILFGCLRRRGEELSWESTLFLDFLRAKLACS